MIRAIIADDEDLGRDSLKRVLEKDPDIQILASAANGVEALEAYKKSGADVMFLDVQMPGLDGLDVASRVVKDDSGTLVVFVTAHDKYALEAFEKNAIDYILKPIREERMKQALTRIKERCGVPHPMREHIEAVEDQLIAAGRIQKLIGYLPNKRLRVLLDPKDIRYFHVKQEIVHVIMEGQSQEYILRSTMKDALQRLDAHQFTQTHKSYAVNLEKVANFEPYFSGSYQILLKGDEKIHIPLSRAFVKSFKKLLGHW